MKIEGTSHEPMEPMEPNWARLVQGPLADGSWFRGYGSFKDGVVIPGDPQPVWPGTSAPSSRRSWTGGEGCS